VHPPPLPMAVIFPRASYERDVSASSYEMTVDARRTIGVCALAQRSAPGSRGGAARSVPNRGERRISGGERDEIRIRVFRSVRPALVPSL
jgi:hypothetical protein